MSYKAIGTLHSVGETLQITTKSGNPFQRRELTIKQERYNPQTGEVYTPNYLQFELTQQHCALADQYAYGTMLEVSFSIEGSLYNDRNTGQERTFKSAPSIASAPSPSPPTHRPPRSPPHSSPRPSNGSLRLNNPSPNKGNPSKASSPYLRPQLPLSNTSTKT